MRLFKTDLQAARFKLGGFFFAMFTFLCWHIALFTGQSVLLNSPFGIPFRHISEFSWHTLTHLASCIIQAFPYVCHTYVLAGWVSIAHPQRRDCWSISWWETHLPSMDFSTHGVVELPVTYAWSGTRGVHGFYLFCGLVSVAAFVGYWRYCWLQTWRHKFHEQD